MRESLPVLQAVSHVPAPESVNQSLVYDGNLLWVGSWETKHIVAIDRTGQRRAHFTAPAKPVGGTFTGERFYYVLSDDDDDRTIISVDASGNWSNDGFTPPDESGSFLSWDGHWLWLSQRHLRRVHRLDLSAKKPLQTIEVGEQILGQTWIGDWLYLSLWLGKDRGGAVLARILRTDPSDVQYVAANEFGMISLAFDGNLLWTNDTKGGRIVGLTLPEVTL